MPIPTVKVYFGDPAAGILIGQTYDGSGDSIPLLEPLVLTQSQYISVVFTGGEAGAQAQVSAYGTREVQ